MQEVEFKGAGRSGMAWEKRIVFAPKQGLRRNPGCL
jgi:hypothetical protein